MRFPRGLIAAAAAAAVCLGAGAAAQPRSGAGSPSRALDRQGEALMRDGRFDDALAAFAKALTMEPNNGRAILLEAQTRATVDPGAAAPVDVAGRPLEAQDFSGLALSGLTIVNVHGPRSDWSQAQLEGVTLAGAQLFEADFSRAQFRRVNLDRSVLDRAILRGADFSGSSLVQARARSLAAAGAKLAGARAAGADFEGADFRGTDLAGADLRASRMGPAEFAGASLANADLRGADLSRARLAGAILKGARVDCATRFPHGFDADAAAIVPLDLCGGVYALDFRGKDLAGMSFRDLDMRGALFAGARLSGADFTGANLDGADFTGATGFEDASFAPVSAREATFENLTGPLRALGGADLRNARLAGPENGELELVVGPLGPRTEGASLRNVRVVLDHRIAPGEPGAGLGLASLMFARIESGRLDCAGAPARGRRDAAAVAEWTAFAETIDTAGRAAAANPGVALGETCRRAAQTWLAGDCEAGYRAAGVRYACPPRR